MRIGDVLKRLERHPLLRQIEAELAADELAERTRLTAEIKELQRQEAATAGPLEAAVRRARVERDRAWIAFRKAETELNSCEARDSSHSSGVAREIGIREARLRELASPDIQATIERLEARFDAERNQPGLSPERVRAYPLAVHALRALQLEASGDVAARLAQIQAAIPE